MNLQTVLFLFFSFFFFSFLKDVSPTSLKPNTCFREKNSHCYREILQNEHFSFKCSCTFHAPLLPLELGAPWPRKAIQVLSTTHNKQPRNSSKISFKYHTFQRNQSQCGNSTDICFLKKNKNLKIKEISHP